MTTTEITDQPAQSRSYPGLATLTEDQRQCLRLAILDHLQSNHPRRARNFDAPVLDRLADHYVRHDHPTWGDAEYTDISARYCARRGL